MTQNVLVPTVVLAVGFVACVSDVRSRRIPNVLTFGAAVAAFIVHGLTGGASGLLGSAGGWFTGTLLFLPFFLLGGMGAGDVKLLAALGAWLGPRETCWLAVYSAIAGGVIGVVVALAQGYLGTALRNVRAMVSYWQTVGFRPVPELTLANAKGPRIAYAVPIFAGTLVMLWL